MRYFWMNLMTMYLIACADDGQDHNKIQRILRTIFWPLTLTSWLRTGSEKTYKLLTSLWIVLTAGWVLSLMADRL